MILCLGFGLTNLVGQINLGYVKNDSNFPTELYLAGHLKKDYKKLSNGSSEPDDEKCYFVSKVEMNQTKMVRDAALMNINGKQITLESKPRKFRSEHDYLAGNTWLYSKVGYRVKFEEFYVGKRVSENERIRLTVYSKKTKKTIILIPARMGD